MSQTLHSVHENIENNLHVLSLVLAWCFLTFSVSVQSHAAPMTVTSWFLQVLSYNLCTVMKIPLDPVTLEQHFKEDNEGPLSSQGYMPYLSTFILDKVPSLRLILTEYRPVFCSSP